MQESNAKLFPKNTTLVALVGATKGRTGYLQFASATNQNIAGLQSTSEKLDNRFLFYTLRSMYNELTKNLAQYDMLNLGNIRDIRIPVPSIEQQKEIVAEIEGYEEKIHEAQAVMDSCAARKQEVLDRYLK